MPNNQHIESGYGNYIADLTENAPDANNPTFKFLSEENEKLKRLLHDLTPGGSEFYNNPEYCAKWIAENRRETHYTMVGIIKNLKQRNEKMVNIFNRLFELCKNTQDGDQYNGEINHLLSEAKAALTPINILK